MKKLHYLTFVVALLFCSCTKEDFDQDIIGTWKKKQTYYGYANGGSFQWHTHPEDHSEVLQLNRNGTFTETLEHPGSFHQHSGTYKIIGNNTVEFTSNHHYGPFTQTIQLEQGRLTIVQQVREGQIIDRYVKID